MNLEHLSGLLFTFAFILYALAFVSYISILASQKKIFKDLGAWLSLVGFVAHSVGLLLRWIAAGISHPPLTNLYESLLFFIWGIVLIHLFLLKKYKIHVIGIFSMMIVIVGMGLAALNPSKEIAPLVPALQSYWLHMHVFFASISYAFFLASAIFALFYIIKSEQTRPFISAIFDAFSLFCLLLGTASSTLLLRPFSLNRIELDHGKVMHTQELVSIPGLNWLCLLLVFLLLASIYNLFKDAKAKKRKNSSLANLLTWASFLTYAGFMLWLAVALFKIEGISPASNPYKLGLLSLGFFIAVIHRLMFIKLNVFLQILPSEEMLDQLSYKSIIVSLPLLTLVVVTGSVWAHYTWGRYWGWDPKETWSLITWLIYAAYLHLRLQKGWAGLRTAIISLIGFMAVIFTYLGVNILLSGLHAYG